LGVWALEPMALGWPLLSNLKLAAHMTALKDYAWRVLDVAYHHVVASLQPWPGSYV